VVRALRFRQHDRCGKMGTLEKDGSSKPLSFDGKAASWPPFKKALHHLLDKEGCGWVVEGGNAFCTMLQAAAAKAAKSTTASGKGTVSTNQGSLCQALAAAGGPRGHRGARILESKQTRIRSHACNKNTLTRMRRRAQAVSGREGGRERERERFIDIKK